MLDKARISTQIEVMSSTTMKTKPHIPMTIPNPSNSSNTTKVKPSKHWRSAGWTPLVYPASALIANAKVGGIAKVNDSAKINLFFPLHEAVLQAAARELLILEGSIECKTLKLSSKVAVFRKSLPYLHKSGSTESENTAIGPCYLKHVHFEKNIYQHFDGEFLMEQSKSTRKRNISISSQLPSLKKLKGTTAVKHTVVRFDEEKSSFNFTEETIEGDKLECAEALVNIMVRRALHFELGGRATDESKVKFQGKEERRNRSQRPPRKVSDADSECAALAQVAATTENEISQFFDINARIVEFRRNEIPLMVDVSIATEQQLRKIAFEMVSKMTKSLGKETLRLFLGYRASSVKHEKVLSVLSDFLYDVSHAFFAWNQTEQELLTTLKSNSHTPYSREMDSIVKNSLFDHRALKKIGGFGDCSLLRHALSIARCSCKGETWETFANSQDGQKLLAHHAEGKAFLAGQKRRAHRAKHRDIPSSAENSEEGGLRSRSSSIASFDDVDSTIEQKQRSEFEELLDFSETRLINLPKILHLTLKKETYGEAWGVLLAREGDMCLVDRAPKKATCKAAMLIIRQGDMILSVENERGESASPPSSIKPSERKPHPDWFREIVTLFKTSSELHLVIRRV